ncbi:hypothetical protein T07_2458 [Trichinella nelsoni]|uniref:Uncharacterized protein n=1 Tax=Trichinella nelsoni TaxID=6336 RepID=A0A0V0RD64_9BILA|nr:hypothetical protein T07_2458 [Trichinella nelsoni]
MLRMGSLYFVKAVGSVPSCSSFSVRRRLQTSILCVLIAPKHPSWKPVQQSLNVTW